MKMYNSPRNVLMAIGTFFLLYSCNEPENKAEEPDQVQSTDTVITMKAAEEPVFKPFDIVQIIHSVKDYDKWKPLFDSDSTARLASGLKTMVLGRETDKANNVMVVLTAEDMAKAKSFAADPRLKTVMEKGGITSKPEIQYFKIIRYNEKAKGKTWVVIVHRVKDFDGWLKVFDAEGMAGREGQGLTDAAICRGIDDPNMVQVVFDINDIAKAKAAIFSDEKKKLMESAGVEGKPTINFYNTAD